MNCDIRRSCGLLPQMVKTKYSIAIIAASIASAFSLQSCYCSPFEFTLPSAVDSKIIEWQRNSNGSSEAYHRNDFAEAERLGKAAVKIAEGFPADDQRLFTTLHNLVFVYEDQKKWAEAEQLLMRSLQIAKGNPMKTAEVYSGLSTLYACQGNVVKSDEMEAAALAAAESGPAKATPSNPEDAELLGRLLLHAKRYAEAEPVLLQTLKMQEERYGADHLLVADSLVNLAKTYVSEGRLSAAEPLYKRAIAICEKQTPPCNGQLAVALSMYAELLEKMKRTDEAKQLYNRSDGLIQGSSH
jgi:tetratricopeptide (TPR) repeat protein